MEHWTIDDFTDQLADKAPVPGGGGASALAGALGAALGHMGAALTVGKKRYASYEQTLERHMQQLEAYRQTLQTGIQHDANAFLKLREAYSLPAQTQRERQNRTDAIQRALRVAVQPPMDTLDNGVKVAQSLHELRPITSKQVLSDIGMRSGHVPRMYGSGVFECDHQYRFYDGSERSGDAGMPGRGK